MNSEMPAGHPPGTPSAEPGGYGWNVLSTVLFGVFMVILDTTVVNVAFQAIRNEFGGNLNDAQWVISVYVMVLGITTPLAGFLADRVGAKKVYLSALGMFAVGSLLCGLSTSLPMLVAARAVQGLGGGLVMPLGMALLLQAFPPREHGVALGIFGIAGLVAPAIGPIVGGWLVDQHLWRVIFFINPPIGLVGVVLGWRFLRDRPSESRPALDLAGIVAEVVGFGAILYAASIAADQGWTSPGTLLFFAFGAAGLVAFGLIELKWSKSPLLDLRLFGNSTFRNASLMGYVSTVALFGAEFLMPVYLQSLRGQTALETGLILLPMAIAGGVLVTLSGRLYDRVGPRPLLVAGFVLLMVNTWQLSQIRADTTISWIIFLLVLRGLALGLTVQTTVVTALSVVPRLDLPRGSSLTNATRLVIQSIGVAVLATVLASTLSPQVKAFQDQTNSGPSGNGQTSALCQPSLDAATGPDASSPGGAVHLSLGQGVTASPALRAPDPTPGLMVQACRENIAGFEEAYLLTFFAACLALVFGLTLPGWPAKWTGRHHAEDGATIPL